MRHDIHKVCQVVKIREPTYTNMDLAYRIPSESTKRNLFIARIYPRDNIFRSRASRIYTSAETSRVRAVPRGYRSWVLMESLSRIYEYSTGRGVLSSHFVLSYFLQNSRFIISLIGLNQHCSCVARNDCARASKSSRLKSLRSLNSSVPLKRAAR